jgi:fructose-1,6-bisphosphatase/inositol monophosphatase family enzyme
MDVSLPCAADRSRKHAAIGHGWRRIAWIAPYVALWLAALSVLKAGALGSDCTAMCMVANGWLWYTVFYATLSLSAFVGAIEVLFWMFCVDRASEGRAESPNH